MKDEQRFFVNYIAKAAGLVINLVISFFLTPFVITHVGRESYGFVGLANDFADIARIASVALNDMAIRFISVHVHAKEYEKATSYFASAVFLDITVCLLLCIPTSLIICFLHKFLHVSAHLVFDVRILFALVFFNLLLSVINGPFSAALFCKNRIDKETCRSTEGLILRALLLFVCFGYFAPHIYYIGAASCVMSVYVLLTNIYYTRKYYPLFVPRKHAFQKNMVKTFIISGGLNCLLKASSVLSTGTDLFFVNLYCGGDFMGAVSVSKTVPATLLSLFVILSAVFLPQMTKDYAQGNNTALHRHTATSVLLTGMLSAIPLAFLFVFGSDFYRLWTPSENSILLHQFTCAACFAYPVMLPMQPVLNLFTVKNKLKTVSLHAMIAAAVTVAITPLVMILFKTPQIRVFFVLGSGALYQLYLYGVVIPVHGAKLLHLSCATLYKPLLCTIGSCFVLTGFAYILRHILLPANWGQLILCGMLVCLLGAIPLATVLYKQYKTQKSKTTDNN